MKKSFSVIFLALFLLLAGSVMTFAAQYNRYQSTAANEIKNMANDNIQVIDLIVDFSSSMTNVVNKLYEVLDYLVPQLNDKKLGLRAIAGRNKSSNQLSVSKIDPPENINTTNNNQSYQLPKQPPVQNCKIETKKVYKEGKLYYSQDYEICNPGTKNETIKKVDASSKTSLPTYGRGQQGKIQNFSPWPVYDCDKTELLVPIKINNANTVLKAIKAQEVNGGTPIISSLQEAIKKDLANFSTRKKIIMITDGFGCGDTCAYLEPVLKKNKNLVIDVIIVGNNNNLRCLSEATGGKYYNVNLNDNFDKAIKESLGIKAQPQTNKKQPSTPQPKGYKFVDFNN